MADTDSEWKCCTCLRSFWGNTAASHRAQIHRCRRKHVKPHHLGLAAVPSSKNVLAVILSYSGNKHMVRRTREHLVQAGFPDEAIHVRYGYNIDRDHWMGRPIAGNEIVHLGFLHYWAPFVESMLVAGTAEAGTAEHTLMWIEDDIRVCSPFSAILQEFTRSPKPICWLGFEKKRWSGSQLIGFKGCGLRLAFQVASNRPSRTGVYFRHLDCLWIQTLNDHIHWPQQSLATQLDHWSSTSNFLREGQHKRRILDVSSGPGHKRASNDQGHPCE